MPNLQLQQLLNLLFLLIIGYFTANIYLSWIELFFILSFTVLLEQFLIFFKKNKLNYFSYSSSITAIGVILMMISTQYWIYYIVIAFALLQKHFLISKTQHMFNPSNFALIIALLFFYDEAHIVLGQLGDDVWLLYGVLFIGMVILWKVKRWVISIVFVLSYLGFQYLFIASLDPLIIFEDIYERFYSISFIVFILFMLTDPRTTPSKVCLQGFFAFFVALMATVMDYLYGFRVQHLFMALFVLSSFYGLFVRQNFFGAKDKTKRLILFVLVLSVILFIQNKEPYYFEMDG